MDVPMSRTQAAVKTNNLNISICGKFKIETNEMIEVCLLVVNNVFTPNVRLKLN